MRLRITSAVLAACALLTTASSQTPDIWVCGYYPGWAQGAMPPAAIDYTGLTHVIHFSMLPAGGGRIRPQFITHSQSVAAVAAAHGATKKILLCLGGASTRDSFVVATQPANLPALVKNITDSVRSLNYDGVDIDWEPVTGADTAQFGALSRGLRASLDTMNPPRMLTAAIGGDVRLYARYAASYDQMNIMTYGMSNAWPGWVTWHSSPLYDGGYRFPSTNGPVPSVDGEVGKFLAGGIPAAKLGFGMGFYGALWRGGAGTATGGVTAPRQAYTTDPTVQSEVPYRDIMTNNYSAAAYRWDTAAAAAYLSMDQSGSASDSFLSYEDTHTAAAKVAYARAKPVGGFIIWHIQHGYFPTRPVGQRNPLLAAISQALQATPVRQMVVAENQSSRRAAPEALVCIRDLRAQGDGVYDLCGRRLTSAQARGMRIVTGAAPGLRQESRRN
jgi:chitinase